MSEMPRLELAAAERPDGRLGHTILRHGLLLWMQFHAIAPARERRSARMAILDVAHRVEECCNDLRIWIRP